MAFSQDVYLGIATTQKTYGENYSVSIELHGTRTNGKFLEKVLVDGERIYYSKDINKDGSYWFINLNDHERYYFTW
tara:strand:- start:4952 stop:5179 length:228 start_codon:yes stop_codon:yes gene_type:complete